MDWLCAAHDFFHIERVVKLARKIRSIEWIGDELVIEIWALLHESLDDKFFAQSDMQWRKNDLINFLWWLWLKEDIIENIMFIIENVWYW